MTKTIKSRSTFVIALLTATLVAAGPSAAPKSADDWFALADRDAADAHAWPLLLELFVVSPTPDRKKLALDGLPDFEATMQGENGKRDTAISYIHDLLGDPQPIEIPAAGQPTTRPGTDAPGIEMAAAQMIVCGRGDDVAKLDLQVTTLSKVCRILSESGRPDAVRQIVDLERKTVSKPGQNRPDDVRTVARDCASCGTGEVAIEFAAGIDDPGGELRFKVFVAVADQASPAVAAIARHRAVELVKSHPDGKFFDRQEMIRYSGIFRDDLFDLTIMCGRAKDAADFDDASAALLSRLDGSTGDGSDLQVRIKIARFAAVAGSKKYPALLADACKRAEEDSNPSMQAIEFYKLAGVCARAGDSAGADKFIERSKSAGKINDYNAESLRLLLSQDFADAGNFDRARELAAHLENFPPGFPAKYIAFRQADAGRFDDAWKAAGVESGTLDLAVAEYTAIAQVHQGGAADVVKRISKLSPENRFEIELAVGSELKDGKPFKSPRDLNRADR